VAFFNFEFTVRHDKFDTMRNNLRLKLLAIAAIALGLGLSARAGDLTAYQLIKEGTGTLGEEAKDQVVQIRSEKIHRHHDADHLVCRLLRSGRLVQGDRSQIRGGQKMDVKRPFRVLEMASADKKLDRKK